MNAVIYARYSSDAQREESIEGQLRENLSYAKSKGLNIVGEYIDRAISGTTDKRPEFLRMIKDSAQRKFDVVLVWKLDRFSRNRHDSALYKATLRLNGVKVVSATETIADDSSGILLESVLEGFAEYYSADLSEKVVRGLTENALKCKYNGGALPFGLRVDSNQMFQVDPVKAPIVVSIFEQYAEGKTLKAIADYTKSLGVKNSQGKPLSTDTINDMLKNRRYLGEYIYRDIVTPNAFDPIIDVDLFEKVQERKEKNKKAPARFKAKKEMYFLSTKLFCEKCGAFMVGESGVSKKGKFHQYYKCSSVKNKKGCDKKTVRKADIEDIVINKTLSILEDSNIISKLVDQIYDAQMKENTKIPQLKKEIASVTRSIDNLISAMEQGIITPTTKKRLDELEDTKSNLCITLAREEVEKPLLSKDHIQFFFHKMKLLDLACPDGKQILVDNFINSIYLNDETIIFTFNDNEGSKTLNLSDIQYSDIQSRVVPPA